MCNYIIMQVFEEIIQIHGHCLSHCLMYGEFELLNPHPQILTCEKEIVACCSTPHFHSFSMTKQIATPGNLPPHLGRASFSNSLAFFDTWHPPFPTATALNGGLTATACLWIWWAQQGAEMTQGKGVKEEDLQKWGPYICSYKWRYSSYNP